MTMSQCRDCGQKFISIGDEELWCPGCRKKKHEALSKMVKKELADSYIECPHCHFFVKKEIYVCSCGKRLRE